jgi:hypothetical protein
MAASQLIQKLERLFSFLKYTLIAFLVEGEKPTCIQEPLLSVCGGAAQDVNTDE